MTKKEKGKVCEWCGSNDLVCGKAWKEERAGLKKQIDELTKQVEAGRKAVAMLNEIGECLYPIQKDFEGKTHEIGEQDRLNAIGRKLQEILPQCREAGLLKGE